MATKQSRPAPKRPPQKPPQVPEPADEAASAKGASPAAPRKGRREMSPDARRRRQTRLRWALIAVALVVGLVVLVALNFTVLSLTGGVPSPGPAATAAIVSPTPTAAVPATAVPAASPPGTATPTP